MTAKTIWKNTEPRVESQNFNSHIELMQDGTQVTHSITPSGDFIWDTYKPVYRTLGEKQ